MRRQLAEEEGRWPHWKLCERTSGKKTGRKSSLKLYLCTVVIPPPFFSFWLHEKESGASPSFWRIRDTVSKPVRCPDLRFEPQHRARQCKHSVPGVSLSLKQHPNPAGLFHRVIKKKPTKSKRPLSLVKGQVPLEKNGCRVQKISHLLIINKLHSLVTHIVFFFILERILIPFKLPKISI